MNIMLVQLLVELNCRSIQAITNVIRDGGREEQKDVFPVPILVFLIAAVVKEADKMSQKVEGVLGSVTPLARTPEDSLLFPKNTYNIDFCALLFPKTL